MVHSIHRKREDKQRFFRPELWPISKQLTYKHYHNYLVHLKCRAMKSCMCSDHFLVRIFHAKLCYHIHYDFHYLILGEVSEASTKDFHTEILLPRPLRRKLCGAPSLFNDFTPRKEDPALSQSPELLDPNMSSDRSGADAAAFLPLEHRFRVKLDR